MKKFVLGASFVTFVVYGFYCMVENSEQYLSLRERVNGSVVLSCSHATGRGARGEVYKTTIYALRDKNGMEWLYTPRYLQYELLVCPIIEGD